MDVTHPEKGDQPRGSFPAGVLVRRPILLSRPWLVFLLWTFASAVKISLPPLPACKGHVPDINPESPRLTPWLGIPAGAKAWGCWVCTPSAGDPLARNGLVTNLLHELDTELWTILSSTEANSSWLNGSFLVNLPLALSQAVLGSPSLQNKLWRRRVCLTSSYSWFCAWFFVQTSPGMAGTGFQVKYKRRVIECLMEGVSVSPSQNEGISCA